MTSELTIDDLAERNPGNVARTASCLELDERTRSRAVPWLLVAHPSRREALGPFPNTGTTRFMRAAWQRYEREGGGRKLVLDLVHSSNWGLEDDRLFP